MNAQTTPGWWGPRAVDGRRCPPVPPRASRGLRFHVGLLDGHWLPLSGHWSLRIPAAPPPRMTPPSPGANGLDLPAFPATAASRPDER